MDARNYVDELLEKQRNGEEIPRYDFIYEDALNDYSIPFQLVTKELRHFASCDDPGILRHGDIDRVGIGKHRHRKFGFATIFFTNGLDVFVTDVVTMHMADQNHIDFAQTGVLGAGNRTAWVI